MSGASVNGSNASGSNADRGGTAPSGAAWDAVVLAGGRGSRLGGVDKAAIVLERERLVDRAIAAARAAGAARVIVAGPVHAGERADAVVREDPPFSGPLAAVAAATGAVRAPWTVLLACDLVRPADATAQLVDAMRRSAPSTGAGRLHDPAADGPHDGAPHDGAILVDGDGHPQWLACCVRTPALLGGIERARTEAGGSLADRPLRSALGPLRLARLPSTAGSTDDIDTEAHLVRARAELENRKEDP